MRLEWLMNPLTYYGALAAGLSICLHLFLTVQARLRAVSEHRRQDQGATAAAINELRGELAAARRFIQEAEHRAQAAEALAFPQPAQGINLNKRALVLRMAGKGERPDQIAAALRVPQNEVDLVLKVHRASVMLKEIQAE